MAGTIILVQQSPRMYYNESSAPRYSRNPLAARDSNLESTSTFKRDSSLSQSFQLWGKTKAEPSRTESTYQILSSSFFNRMEPNSSSKTNKELELSRKELKIKKLRKEINNDENDHRAQHNRLSQHSQVSKATTLKTNKYATQKIQTQASFTAQKEESLFSPKILTRSKSLVRKIDVSTLLFQDAKRRQDKEQFMVESDRKQRELLMSPKINSNTNALVLNKIRNEFKQLVTEEEVSPLIALSVLEELFNVSLNPHKQSNESVQRLIKLLTEDNCYGQTKRDRLWQFICVVINGHSETNIFSMEQEKEIKQNYQYLYKERVTRERRSPSPQQPTFRPKTLQSSNKLAHSFRQKTCQKVNDFVKNQKVNLNLKDHTYAIEDLYIIQHHRKLAQNQHKKREKENKELALCTFKPDLSPSASTQPKARQKPRISLRAKPQQVKTQCTLSQSSDNTKLGFSKITISRQKFQGWKGESSGLLNSYQSLV